MFCLFFFTDSQAANSTFPTSRTLSTAQAFNTIIGTQTITPRYQFTSQTRLVETAEGIRDMGSNILKIAVGPDYAKQYSLPRNPEIGNLTDLVTREPSFRHVFDMPFATYILWTYPFASCNWKDGLSESEHRREYDEIYAFARHLLTTYNGTHKRFLFGHWEGDWWLLGHSDPKKDPTPEAIQGMTDWYNVRQDALEAARRDTPHHDVEVYQYAEVNLGQKALDGGITVTNNVLPRTRVDYVSYSCYDTLNFGLEGNAISPTFKAILDHLESRLPAKPGLTGKRVFIGEFGFPLETSKTPQFQAKRTRDTLRAAIEWGCPYVLYWQYYCNEAKEGGADARGFWMVDNKGAAQPVRELYQRYYQKTNVFMEKTLRQTKQVPDANAFRHQALRYLEELIVPGQQPEAIK